MHIEPGGEGNSKCFDFSLLAYFMPKFTSNCWVLNFIVACTFVGKFLIGWRVQKLKIRVIVHRISVEWNCKGQAS